MGRRPASEQGDTLEEIRTAAFRLFGRYGYDGVSLNRVAKDSGVTKAALYWHFDGKAALYVACLAQLYERFGHHVFQPMKDADGPIPRLVELFRGILRLLDDPMIRGGVAGFWMTPSSTEVPDAATVRTQFAGFARTMLSGTIATGIERGDFRAIVEPDAMADAIVAIVESIVLPLQSEDQAHVRRLLWTLAHTFFVAHCASEEKAQLAIALLDQNGDT